MTSLDLNEAAVEQTSPAAPQALPGRNGLAPRMVEIVLLLLFAYLLAKTALAIFSPLPLPKGERLAALSNRDVQSAPVTARNPFPMPVVEAAPVEAAPDLAETALDLALTGVWPGEQEGSAIIRRPDGKQRRLAVGEEIVPGVTLVAVYSDQVIIEQNGVRESLRFESKAPVERAPQRGPSASASSTPAKIDNRGDDAGLVLNALRLESATDASGAPAIAIYPGRDQAAFDAAGLKAGDILRSINGAPPPSNQQDIAALMRQLARVGAANIVVERDGTPMTLSLSINQIRNE
ncbi:MAG: type II secretion system protein N [Pseudomonadota bacterium]